MSRTRICRSGGIHFCLGAPLGRQELQVSFTTLMDRFPNLKLVEEPAWKPNYVIRGLEGLRIRACAAMITADGVPHAEPALRRPRGRLERAKGLRLEGIRSAVPGPAVPGAWVSRSCGSKGGTA